MDTAVKVSVGLTLALIVVTVTACTPSPDRDNSQERITEAIALMDDGGLFATGDDWKTARAKALASDVPANKVSNVIREALLVAGGPHSALLFPGEFGTSVERREPEATVVDGIGVLALPSIAAIGGDQVTSYVATGTAALEAPAECGWVLDLRENYGGNMYPMFAAIAALLDVDQPMKFIDRNGVETPVEVTADGVSSGDDSGLEFPLDRFRAIADSPLAVLTSDRTGSSGEAVAIALTGRPGTRSFGETTHGFATGNEVYQLLDGSTLLLTEAWTATRDGTIFPDGITPDTITQQPLDEAQAWLRDRCNP